MCISRPPHGWHAGDSHWVTPSQLIELVCPAGTHSDVTFFGGGSLDAGLHQIVIQYFNAPASPARAQLVITDPTSADVSSSFVHDPMGPCNTDCDTCNPTQRFCETCRAPEQMPVGGVCTSPLSVTP